MDYITVTAKTLDDAITDALVQLGVTSDQLDYEVIEKGSAGFLGIGVKQAVIKARKKVEEPEVKEEPVKEEKKDTEPVKDHAGHTEKPAKEKKHKNKHKKEEKPAEVDFSIWIISSSSNSNFKLSKINSFILNTLL